MGRRKGRKIKAKVARPTVPTIFDCPFCNHEKTVFCKMDRKVAIATIRCRMCGAHYQSQIHFLSEPIDVYSEWLDESEKVNREESEREQEHNVQPKEVSDNIVDEDLLVINPTGVRDDDDEDRDDELDDLLGLGLGEFDSEGKEISRHVKNIREKEKEEKEKRESMRKIIGDDDDDDNDDLQDINLNVEGDVDEGEKEKDDELDELLGIGQFAEKRNDNNIEEKVVEERIGIGITESVNESIQESVPVEVFEAVEN